jgi:hypothetical protein
MSDKLFLLGWICFAGLLGFFGILMLIGSDGSTRLLYRVLGGNQLLGPNTSRTTRFPLQWRMAGLALTAISVGFIAMPLYWILGASAEAGGDITVAPPVTGRRILFAMLVVLFLFGFYLFLKPRGIVSLSRFLMPDYVSSRGIPPFGVAVVRFIAMCFIAFALYGGFMLIER